MNGVEFLRKQSRRFRVLAQVLGDQTTIAEVLRLALECDRLADALEASRDATDLPKT